MFCASASPSASSARAWPAWSFPSVEQLLDVDRELEQPDRVRDVGAGDAHPIRQLLLLEPQLLEQLPERLGELDRAQVLAMDVLDQRLTQRVGVVGVADHDRDRGQPGELGRAQPPFAGDQLVARAGLADDDRLQDPDLTDRDGERRDRLVVEVRPRLLRVGGDRVRRAPRAARRPPPPPARPGSARTARGPVHLVWTSFASLTEQSPSALAVALFLLEGRADRRPRPAVRLARRRRLHGGGPGGRPGSASSSMTTTRRSGRCSGGAAVGAVRGLALAAAVGSLGGTGSSGSSQTSSSSALGRGRRAAEAVGPPASVAGALGRTGTATDGARGRLERRLGRRRLDHRLRSGRGLLLDLGASQPPRPPRGRSGSDSSVRAPLGRSAPV